MWYDLLIEIQRTVTITFAPDDDLRHTLDVFREVQAEVSEAAYADGQPISAVELQRRVYHDVKGRLSSQMTITALRLVVGAYASAKRNKRPAQRPFTFGRRAAMFLVGQRGRDADFRADGTLSIWTVGGRKRLAYTMPEDFRSRLAGAKEIDSVTVIERDGKLIGRVALTLEVPKPRGVLPVGIDLNETNALVAVDPDGRELFISGRSVKVANIRNQKTRSRLQRHHAAHKAEGKDTRSVRRLLKRLGRKQSNRTRTFAQQTARQLADWAPADAVLVFEDLSSLPQPKRSTIRGKEVRRRLSLWQRGLIRQATKNAAEVKGQAIDQVNPYRTSKNCSRCGLLGRRRRHSFECPHCGHRQHADLNAATNIRNRFTALRGGGPPSTGPEALAVAEGKPLPSCSGS